MVAISTNPIPLVTIGKAVSIPPNNAPPPPIQRKLLQNEFKLLNEVETLSIAPIIILNASTIIGEAESSKSAPVSSNLD